MRFYTFSLRAMFGIVTVVGISIFAYLEFQPETWNSGLSNCEIHFAQFSFDDAPERHQLSKRDAIEFVRLAEKCPLREYDECPTSYLPQPGPLFTAIELELSGNRTFGMALIGDCLQTEKQSLVDISSRRVEMFAILQQTD